MQRKRPKIDKSLLTYGVPKRVTDLAYRRQVQGKPCDVWGCTHDPATVVGAHYTVPLPGLTKGRGLKQHDGTIVYACFEHHAEIDGRKKVSPERLMEIKEAIIVGLIMRNHGMPLPDDMDNRMPVPADVMDKIHDKLILFYAMRRFLSFEDKKESS